MMRAKFRVTSVTKDSDTQETIQMAAVTEKPFDANGESEDNSFARWTPCGSLSISIQNPNLLGTFKEGQKYYLDFTQHVD